MERVRDGERVTDVERVIDGERIGFVEKGRMRER